MVVRRVDLKRTRCRIFMCKSFEEILVSGVISSMGCAPVHTIGM